MCVYIFIHAFSKTLLKSQPVVKETPNIKHKIHRGLGRSGTDCWGEQYKKRKTVEMKSF